MYSPLLRAVALLGLNLLVLFAGKEALMTGGASLGRAAQVDPIKPMLNLPGTKRLKLKCDEPLSRFAFKFKLRRYSWGWWCWPPPPPTAG